MPDFFLVIEGEPRGPESDLIPVSERAKSGALDHCLAPPDIVPGPFLYYPALGTAATKRPKTQRTSWHIMNSDIFYLMQKI